MSRERWVVVLAGAVTGALLFVADYPVHAWWIELVAFLPLLWGLARAPSWRWAAAAGAAAGLAYTGPLALVLEFPALMGAGLAGVLSLFWVAAALGAWRVGRWAQPLGALAVASVFVLVEWTSYTVVPVWGTAQCFARVWSAAPEAIAFVRLTGISGLVFVLVGSQALVIALVRARGRARVGAAAALALLVTLPVAYALARAYHRADGPRVRVATIGWTWRDLDQLGAHEARGVIDRVIAPAAGEAAAAGARLLVTPEVGIALPAGTRELLVRELAALAARHRIALAIGVFDVERQDNRILSFDAGGRPGGEYVKTHLIPFLERYHAGDGSLLDASIDGARLGGMICQDDNFTDLARGYGRRAAQLVAVPTNDWRQVAPYHLENARLRGIENGYAIIRAASNGISLIADARGRVLARADHFALGARLLIADVPLEPAGTLHSRLEWLPFVCALLLALGIGRGLIRRVRGRPAAP